MNCPIIEQTSDGVNVGRCWFYLNEYTCPRHGNVEEEVKTFLDNNGKLTLENIMRKRKGQSLLGNKI
jgi:hypothetical protein